VALNLGGVQGVAALALGLFGNRPADILVRLGNPFVAEAKRILKAIEDAAKEGMGAVSLDGRLIDIASIR
jgi:histidinol dehydrogenase